MRKNRRWRLMIYPKFQYSILALNLSLITAIFGVSIFQQWRSLANLQRIGTEARLPPGHPYFKLLDYQSAGMQFHLTVAFVIILIISTFATLLLSNKLAGPIVRMKSFFTRIAERGAVTEKMCFRKNDFFYELPGEIHKALDRLIEKREKQ